AGHPEQSRPPRQGRSRPPARRAPRHRASRHQAGPPREAGSRSGKGATPSPGGLRVPCRSFWSERGVGEGLIIACLSPATYPVVLSQSRSREPSGTCKRPARLAGPTLERSASPPHGGLFLFKGPPEKK